MKLQTTKKLINTEERLENILNIVAIILLLLTCGVGLILVLKLAYAVILM